MGMRTDAIIFYGVCLEEGNKKMEGAWEEAAKEFNPKALGPLAKLLWYTDQDLEWAPSLYPEEDEKYRNSKVVIVQHCSEGAPMFAIAAKDSVMVATRGNPQRLFKGSASFFAPLPWIRDVVEFCRTHGLEIKLSDIGWHVASYWSN